MTDRSIKGKGIMDYDLAHDVLFFKTKNRKYSRSIEMSNMVIDVDEEDFITGIQIFGASEFLSIPKIHLKQIKDWQFEARTSRSEQGTTIEVKLFFKMSIRNRVQELKNPIIIQQIPESMEESVLMCKA